jgi:hypothetical protein
MSKRASGEAASVTECRGRTFIRKGSWNHGFEEVWEDSRQPDAEDEVEIQCSLF